MSIAVVTGGAGDIGTATCRVLGKSGHTIAVVDIDADRCAFTARQLKGEGFEAFAAPADITDIAAVEAMAEAVQKQGDVAVVVNNAGKAIAPDFESTTEAIWQDGLALNLSGAFFVTRRFLPGMKARGAGVVVNVSSGNGIGTFGDPAYSVAKAGLLHFTRMLAVEYGPAGIRAVSVVPGTVRTRAWAQRVERNPHIMEELRKWAPLRRISEPEDVANAIGFAASDAARAITGSEITVDCGAMTGNDVLAQFITDGDQPGQ